MQLVELLPHVSRLLPIADRYFASKAAGERASESALAVMAEGVQADLGQVAKAHASLHRQLQEQGVQIAAVGDDVRQLRRSLEQSERKAALLEQRVQSLTLWVKLGLSAITTLLIVVLALLFRTH
jgi:hypothetical protein